MPIYGVPLTDKQLFDVINVVLPGWVVLAIAPWWRHSQTISAACALVMAALYTATMVTQIAFPDNGSVDLADMFSYEGVVRLLGTKAAVLPAWVHYAAFDLWVGRWVAGDSVARGVPQLLLIPCLVSIMFLGPMGLLLYFLIRIPFNKAGKAAGKRKIA